MPYRDRAAVQRWVDEYAAAHPTPTVDMSVLEKDFTPGPNSGMVVVAMRKAPTIAYIQPFDRDGRPRWIVTFEERSEAVDLTGPAVAQLAAEFAEVARLCDFLQVKTDGVLRAAQAAPAAPTTL